MKKESHEVLENVKFSNIFLAKVITYQYLKAMIFRILMQHLLIVLRGPLHYNNNKKN
jgi:hypothetical protein